MKTEKANRLSLNQHIHLIIKISRQENLPLITMKSYEQRRCKAVSLLILSVLLSVLSLRDMLITRHENAPDSTVDVTKGFIQMARAHIVLTRDDRGQSLVLTGEDGKGGKGGKGKGGGGDQLVIAGNTGGGGGSTNMIMQDAANREGDVVINGNSMIVPGEDGHIVLADGRNRGGASFDPPPANPFAFWLPYLYSRSAFNLSPFFGNQFG